MDGYLLARPLLPLLLLLVVPAKLREPELPPVPLLAATHHVQGIDLEGSTLWLSSVDRGRRRGLLFSFDLASGRLLRSAEVQRGARYHAGGISLDGDSLWVPVAEYRPRSSTLIQRRDRNTFALQAEFEVEDHIGAVAVVPEGILGANWGARVLYLWSREGKLLRTFSNPSGLAIQDMKYVSGALVVGGLGRFHLGSVVWLGWPDLGVRRRMRLGFSDRGVAYSHAGVALRGRTLYFVPEDGRSRVFAFDLPAEAL